MTRHLRTGLLLSMCIFYPMQSMAMGFEQSEKTRNTGGEVDSTPKVAVDGVHARSHMPPQEIKREIIGRDGGVMILIPSGNFFLGEQEHKHQVSLADFYIDKFEVTTNLYRKFLLDTRHGKPRYWGEVGLTHGERPVVGVDLEEAHAYCRWAGKRLPTDQEWEKAARGADGRMYPWGNEDPTPLLANYEQSWCGLFCSVYEERLKPVASYEAGKSPYGIYNMAGNVLEWTAEGVVRGGSWYSLAANLRAAYKRGEPAVRHGSTGVRCAQDAVQ